MSDPDRVETGRHGDFWSQVPVVLFTVAAVVAIFVVNSRATQAASPPAAIPAATEIQLAPVGCADCGEVIAVRQAAADEVGAPGQLDNAVLLDVRMSDGSVRTIKQFAPGFEVGALVQVNGNALVARN